MCCRVIATVAQGNVLTVRTAPPLHQAAETCFRWSPSRDRCRELFSQAMAAHAMAAHAMAAHAGQPMEPLPEPIDVALAAAVAAAGIDRVPVGTLGKRCRCEGCADMECRTLYCDKMCQALDWRSHQQMWQPQDQADDAD